MPTTSLPAQPPSNQPLFATSNPKPKFQRLWNDNARKQQCARIEALDLKCCRSAGQTAWQSAADMHAKLPENVRIDLPGPKVFGDVLGLYKSTASLQYDPMTDLQLSGSEIARVTGHCKSVVEAALRWLGCDAILYKGVPVAEGLGFIQRIRRTAKALVEGAVKSVYRTSESKLTAMGQALVRLKAKVTSAATMRKPAASRKPVTAKAKPGPLPGLPTRPCGTQKASVARLPVEKPNWEAGLQAAKRISEDLAAFMSPRRPASASGD